MFPTAKTDHLSSPPSHASVTSWPGSMTPESKRPRPAPPPAKTLDAEFRTTRWTQVNRAKTDSPEGRRALAELCQAYYEPVVAFLRCELREADAARELAHEFFTGVLG